MLAAKELVYPGFLAEVELGEGPPMDLVKMNLAYSAAAQGDDDADEDEEDEEGDEVRSKTTRFGVSFAQLLGFIWAHFRWNLVGSERADSKASG